MSELIKVRDVSLRYDISARALKYYEDVDLISSIKSDDYAYRMYDEEAVKRLEQILILRKLNISIKDIQRIFNTSGSEVVLEILEKKAKNIDDEVALLHELKDVVLEFIQEIEELNFTDKSDVKHLYEKAKEIETKLISVDYIGKPSNINRLIDVTEKLQEAKEDKIIEAPKMRVFKRRLDDFIIAGVKHSWNNGSEMGKVYEKLDSPENRTLRDWIRKQAQPGDWEIGISYISYSPDWSNETIAGGIVENVDEIPEGGYFMKFPASEYLVVTHEWVYKADEAFPLIGKTVGYAHSEEAHIKIPDGYERDNDNLLFIEHYNYKYEENEYRLEIWFAIRKTN